MQKHLAQPPAVSRELKTALEQLCRRMESIASQFEQETDPTLIDCHIYELKAAQLRYQFLLRRAKALEAARQEDVCRRPQPVPDRLQIAANPAH